MPLGSVQDCYVGRLSRNETQQKTPERFVSEAESGKKPLEAPIGRVGLDTFGFPAEANWARFVVVCIGSAPVRRAISFIRARCQPSLSERTRVSCLT
ncbi:hypothetical protein GGQ18_000034 [Salinibacter ruber]|nr:hypothetical protein [Salinibacter ruber]